METNKKIQRGRLQTGRRDFLSRVGSISVMSVFGAAFFTSCTSESDMLPDNEPNENEEGILINNQEVTIDLAKNEGLMASGGWMLIREAQLLVVNLDGQFSALTSVCTHSQCDRNWTFGNQVFTCTCHGSRFDTQGEVVNGPATQPLKSYAVSEENGNLIINRL
ncbi:Rieske (2Fe-2S) protein [Cyclobacterium sp.]|uniref:QcrA and Rieske domain-containing protein n=1 Tax=Cyclobacterium sp. TaxID=1966343 RepID=UPI0019C8203F|nr:Rieske (2Fe-2S) protein [Cyclobacterium sp.]MBD3628045.1 Rieske (2Fe-2S) protein [Cyclobacterium sp.]